MSASAKTTCIEESETVVLVLLLMEYWNIDVPKSLVSRL